LCAHAEAGGSVVEHGLDDIDAYLLRVFREGVYQCGPAQEVDQPRYTLSVLVDEAAGLRAEEVQSSPRVGEAVLDVAKGLLFRQRFQGKVGDDALGELAQRWSG
jgi:hypothetical protein